MGFLLLFAALIVGSDAYEGLNQPVPTSGAWFEAAVTLILILGAVLVLAIHGDE